MKKTFKEIQEIDVIVGELYKKDPALRGSKFGYWYKRFTEKNYEPIVKDFGRELSAVRLEHAMEDRVTKEVLTRQTNRGYAYTKQGLRDVMKAEEKLQKEWEENEFEIEPLKADISVLKDIMQEEDYNTLSSVTEVK